MKKVIYTFSLLSIIGLTTSINTLHAADNVKAYNYNKSQLMQNINTIVSKQGNNANFLDCVKNGDKSVYKTITNKRKMSKLDHQSTDKLYKINTVVNSCNAAKVQN